LEKHLVKKHKVQQTAFSDEQNLNNYLNAANSTTKIIKAVCCECGFIYNVTDNNFHNHCCGNEVETQKSLTDVMQQVNDNGLHESSEPVAVQNDLNRSETTTAIKTNEIAKDDVYCDQAIQQWFQPNVKVPLNGSFSKNINDDPAPPESVVTNLPAQDSISNESSSLHATSSSS
jgi:hypothetical protein